MNFSHHARIAMIAWQFVMLLPRRARRALAARSIYGVYKEMHYADKEKTLSEFSIVIVAPRQVVFGIPVGIKVFGICVRKNRKIVRRFESLKVEQTGENPTTLKYDFYYWRKSKSYWNEGFIKFRNTECGKYAGAEGWFKLTTNDKRTCLSREMQVAFSWERIPRKEIRRVIRKSTINSLADAARFLESNRGSMLSKKTAHHWSLTPLFWITLIMTFLTAVLAWPIIQNWIPR